MYKRQKLICKDGQVKFLASVPAALEEVSATNNSVSAVLDTKTGDVAAQAPVSYTHLDVYKRQDKIILIIKNYKCRF